MEVIIGKIVNTYGLKGALKVYSMTDFAHLRYKKNAKVTLVNPETNDNQILKIASYQQIKGMDIITFAGLNDINLIKQYVGYEIHSIAEQKDLPRDNYYYSDLIDCKVYVKQQYLGKVLNIQNCGNQYNIRIIKDNKKTFLYPFINKFLKEVNVVEKKIILNPIKGMIPDDDN